MRFLNFLLASILTIEMEATGAIFPEEDKYIFTENIIEEVIEETQPTPFILDMDFSTDVDDVMALRVANNLHKQGIIELKAVGLCTSDKQFRNTRMITSILWSQYWKILTGTLWIRN